MIKKTTKPKKVSSEKTKPEAKKTRAPSNKKMPNVIADGMDSAIANLFAEKFYQFLCDSKTPCQGYDEQDIEPEKQIIDMEAHAREMNDAFFDAVRESPYHVPLILSKHYAIVGQKVNLGVQFSRGQKSFQPLEEIKKHQMCLVKVFCWADEAKEDELVIMASRMGAPVIDVYLVEEIKDKLGL